MIKIKAKKKIKKTLADCRLRTVDLFYLMLTALCLLVFTTQINPTIRYVSPTGSNIPPYLSWEDAANSIQDCIDVSEFDDTIYVANGIYEEQVVMITGLSLIGAGTDSCIIDTRDLVNIIEFISVEVVDSCLFQGFHVIVFDSNDKGFGVRGRGNCIIRLNKIKNSGLGFYVEETGVDVPIIYNNVINNVQRGLEIFNASPIVKDNIIYTGINNAATIIAGIHIGAFNNNYRPIIDSNYIEISSSVGVGIRKSFGTRPIIKNNIIKLKNTGTFGIYLSVSDSAIIYNNLIHAEVGREGISNDGVPFLRLYNNYLTGNFDDQQNLAHVLLVRSGNDVKQNVVTNAKRGVQAGGTTDLIFQYNNVWNNDINYSGFTPDTTNLSVDPMIVNDDTTQGKLDFHLQMFSPLIDAGDPEMIDKDGSRIDIGLYGGLYGEVYRYQDLPPKSPRNLTGIVDSATITISWNQNTEADFSYYKLFRDTTAGFTADSSTLVMSLTDTFYTHIIPPDVKSFYYKLTATDNQGNESEVSEELAVSVTSVNTGEPTVVSNYILYQNYPNPFNPSTKIAYKLKERGYVKLYVYAVSGERVSVLVNQTQEAGYYEVEFSASGIGNPESGIRELASGVYIYQVMVKNEYNIPVFSDMKKMLLIK